MREYKMYVNLSHAWFLNYGLSSQGLSLWASAMVKYRKVSKVVGPKRAQLEGATKELEEVTAALNEKKAQLQASGQRTSQTMHD